MEEDLPFGSAHHTRTCCSDSDWRVQLEAVQHIRKLVEDITPAFEEWGWWRQKHPEAHVESIEWIQNMLSAFDGALDSNGLAIHREVLSKLQMAESYLMDVAETKD